MDAGVRAIKKREIKLKIMTIDGGGNKKKAFTSSAYNEHCHASLLMAYTRF